MARSPNYPGVDLKFAVERAERLWSTQQGHAAADEVVMKNLGYAAVSGAGSVTFGALKRFGLLEDAGRGRARLTKLGIAIVRGESTGVRAHDKIREAALKPNFHSVMWKTYRADLPSDDLIEFDLVEEHGFTTKGAAAFLAQYKRTVDFAKLAESSVTVSGNESSEPSEADPDQPEVAMPTTVVAAPEASAAPPVSAPTPGSRSYAIPLTSTSDASLTIPADMNEESWDLMLAVLSAMKTGILRSN